MATTFRTVFVDGRTIIVDAWCCIKVSIYINKESNVNCTLNRLYKIHDVSSFARFQEDIRQRSKRRVFFILCSKYNLYYCICLYYGSDNKRFTKPHSYLTNLVSKGKLFRAGGIKGCENYIKLC